MPTTEPHSITRAREHYGLELTTDDMHAIVGMIEAKESQLTSRLNSDRTERHLVTYGGVQLPVIYDTIRKHIVTVLPACKHRSGPKIKKMRPRQRRSHSDDIFLKIPARFSVRLPRDD